MRYFSWLADGLATGECQFNRQMYRLRWSWSSLRSFYVKLSRFCRMICKISLCHVMSRRLVGLGFENVKHGLISDNGNQGRGISIPHFVACLSQIFRMNSLYDYCEIFVVVSVAPVRVKVTSLMVSKAPMAAALRKPHVSGSVKELTRLAMLVWHLFAMTIIIGVQFQIRLLNFLFAWPLN